MKITIRTSFSTERNVQVNSKHEQQRSLIFDSTARLPCYIDYFCVKMYRFLLILSFVLQSFRLEAQQLEIEMPESEILPESDTSETIRSLWYFFPENRFVDSLRVDSLAQRFAVGLEFQVPAAKIYKAKDPFDPFIHDTFLRKSRGKTWYFLVSLIILLYVIYYRAVFSRQFELRIKSNFKSHAFEDLIRDQQISSAAGSIHAYAIGLSIFVMGNLLYMLHLDFNNLNNVFIYLLVFIGWSGLSFALYVLQWLFSLSLDLNVVLSRNFQRQINLNLLLGLLLLPVFLVAYYNGTSNEDQWVLENMYIILIAWISLRLSIQCIGILRDAALTLTTILYFCSLELIPYLLLIKFLQNVL